MLVYLPPGYEDDHGRRFPVLYLHDGQNIFDGETAYIRGQEWFVDETAQWLISEGMIEPVIIVAVYHAGRDRINEYTPTRVPRLGGGKAASYGRLLTRDLKPFIDRHYRTLPDASNTGLGGSSLGGLVSLYLGLQYPDVFGKLAVMSPSIWWDRRAILREVRHLHGSYPQRIWLDFGTDEGSSREKSRGYLEDSRALRDALQQKGWQEGHTLRYFEHEGGRHDEASFAQRVEPMLRFLYPPRYPYPPSF